MVKHFISLLLLVGLAFPALAVKFEASVDRNEVAEGESLILTLRYNSNTLTGTPDFSPIEKDFEIANQNRKSSFQFVNGKSNSWTIWTLHLVPERLGTLTIPPVTFKGEKSNPVTVTVKKVSAAVKQQQSKQVFFHTETDMRTAYVQGQILYTEKLYFSVPLDNSQLSEVSVEDAIVSQLGDIKHYRTQLDGRSFEVYERRYVIFPQVSGELVIPGPRYTGEMSNGPWRPGRPIRVSQPPTKLQVLPQPASYPQATWLPATDLQLNYQWLGNSADLKVGEPVTLKLTLKAEGLSAAQLPAIPLPELSSLKYYPDQAQTQEQQTQKGMQSTRTQSIAIVPTKEGSITLPEIRLPWWNTQLGRLEYAIIPPQRLTAKADPNAAPTQPVISSPVSNTADTASTQTPTEATGNYLWQIISAVFALLWLATLALWWLSPRAMATNHNLSKGINEPEQQPLSVRKHLKAIKQACRNNDATLARSAILAWASATLDRQISGLDQLADIMTAKQSNSGLIQALKELDYTLYSSGGNDAWQGEYLWQLLQTADLKANTGNSGQLPPLFQSDETTPLKAANNG